MSEASCRELAVDMLGGSESEDWLRAGSCLFAALRVGPRNLPIAEHTGVPVGDVQNYGYRLRAVGIWKGRVMRYPWLDDLLDNHRPDLAAVRFVCQVGIAVGEFVGEWEGDELTVRISRIGEGNGTPRWTPEQLDGMPHRSTLCRGRLRNARKQLV